VKILVLGSNGVVGNGISQAFKNHKIIKVNSNSYNYNSDKYKLSMFAKCDYFIHAAGITEEEIANHGSNKSLKRANIASTRLLNHIVNLGCKNIIYISTLRLYSEKAKNLNEEKTRLNINDSYKSGHWKTENVFKKISEKYKIKHLILRPGAVYGFPSKTNNFNRLKLIPYSFPISLYLNNKIILKSSGIQMRNFCSNKDIGVRVFNWIKNKNKTNILSNISGDKTCSVKDFSYICIKIFKKIFKKKASVDIHFNSRKRKKLIVKQNIKIKNKNKVEKFLKEFFLLLKKNKIIQQNLNN
jgi:nucleoside-diphosphate-sugar epimerase